MQPQISYQESGPLYLPSSTGNDFSIATGGAVARCDQDMIWLGESYRDANDLAEFQASLTRECWFAAGWSSYPSHAPQVNRIDVSTNDRIRAKLLGAYVGLNRSNYALMPAADLLASRAVPLHLRLTSVKASLGLSAKELAEILHCSRAILYVWLKPAHGGQANGEALQRLASLEQLAKTWNAFEVGSLGGHLHGMTLQAEGGRSLYELLKDAPIDIERCEAALQAIARECQGQIAATRRVDELVARGFGR